MPKLYGAVGGQTKEIKKLYGSVNGQTKQIIKLYGSVNGATKLVFSATPDYGTVVYYVDNAHINTTTGILQDQSEVNSLASSSSSYNVTVNGVSVANSEIKEVRLGHSVTSIPANFLYYCENVTNIDVSQSSIVNIPDNFMAISYQTSVPLSISVFPATLRTIGRNFLFTNYRVNQNFSLPSPLTSIGKAFMSECRQMTGVITCECPSSIVEPDGAGAFFETLAIGISTAPAYTTGITLAGNYASDWHATFPDKNSGLYRKTTVS